MLNVKPGFTCLGVDFASFGPLGPEREALTASDAAQLPVCREMDVDPAVIMGIATEFQLDTPPRRPARPLVC